MKIAIIGAGWLGCHIANKLRSTHNITIFEKEDIFRGSSYYNQNRLHRGFHYSRNQKTRNLCNSTFELFTRDYDHIVSQIPNNYYIVPESKSVIDFQTYKGIFKSESIPFVEVNNPDNLVSIEGCLSVDERYIDPIKAKKYFTNKLSDVIVHKEISKKELHNLTTKFDLVLNLTNNLILPLPNHYYELSLTLIYTRLLQNSFGAITMVDGPLFSIYPYKDSDYTVTDVEHTPMFTSSTIEEINNYWLLIKPGDVDELRNKIEQKILLYYPNFLQDFRYKEYYTSVKVKNNSESADRSPTIVQDGNIITCVTGKIQGIYTLENYIKNEINSR